VLEAVLYLDKQNGTNFFGLHESNWNTFQRKQKELEGRLAEAIAKMPERSKGSQISLELTDSYQANKKEQILSTEYVETQLSLLHELNQFAR